MIMTWSPFLPMNVGLQKITRMISMSLLLFLNMASIMGNSGSDWSSPPFSGSALGTATEILTNVVVVTL